MKKYFMTIGVEEMELQAIIDSFTKKWGISFSERNSDYLGNYYLGNSNPSLNKLAIYLNSGVYNDNLLEKEREIYESYSWIIKASIFSKSDKKYLEFKNWLEFNSHNYFILEDDCF